MFIKNQSNTKYLYLFEKEEMYSLKLREIELYLELKYFGLNTTKHQYYLSRDLLYNDHYCSCSTRTFELLSTYTYLLLADLDLDKSERMCAKVQRI